MWRVLVLLLLPGIALADAPATSPLPMKRPLVEVGPVLVASTANHVAAAVRPRARPGQAVLPTAQPMLLPPIAQPATALAAFRPRPRPEAPVRRAAAPEVVIKAAVRTAPGAAIVQGRKGSVCGDPAIRGATLPPIKARLKGCGLDEPVQVTAIDGVRLSMAATMDCTTAKALKTWIQKGLRPAFGKTEVAGLQIAGSYTCRSRNNVPGAPVSEHGRGKAIDISGITLANGKTVSVAKDWRKREGKPMQAAHKAACGIFGTTLGPGSDGHHEDHLHFDTVARRSAYCR
ncbi:extensin family protein [Paracoccaceae bacterium Fryx2]|nr:extensin family protein [Paracoccaceae bacterium Fryx2]